MLIDWRSTGPQIKRLDVMTVADKLVNYLFYVAFAEEAQLRKLHCLMIGLQVEFRSMHCCTSWPKSI